MFYAGIDWADQKHDGLMLDEAGQKLGSIRVAHTRSETGQTGCLALADAGSAESRPDGLHD